MKTRDANCLRRVLRGLVFLATGLGLVSPGAAQPKDPPVGVAVKIWTRGIVYPENETGSVEISGSFLPSTPGGSDGNASAYSSGSYWETPIAAVLGTNGYVRVEPGKAYILTVSGVDYYDADVNIVCPPGYRVIMDHVPRSRVTIDGSANIVFELQPLGARHPGLAGMASDVSTLSLDWRISLGNLRNGSSAGDLTLVDTGMAADWSAIFTPSALHYEPVSDEISVYRPSNIIRQIIANQVVVDVVTIDADTFQICCYHPSQMVGTSDPRTFNGKPYVKYQIQPWVSATSVKIFKEVRNISASNLNPADPPARTEELRLARTGSWPTFEWAATGWTLSGSAYLSANEVQSNGPTSARTEAIQRYGSGGTSLTVNRSFTVPLFNGVSVIGEVVAAETVGSTNALTTTFDYYTDPAQFGSLGHLKSATLPGGNWVSYEYYPTNVLTGVRGGRVKYRYKPYLTAPATVPQTPSIWQGEATYYEYANDVFGAPTRPSLVRTTINGTNVAQETTYYNDAAGTANGLQLSDSIRTDHLLSTGGGLQTTVRYYRNDVADTFVRGQTHSVKAPNGVKKSFAYQRGTWSGTAFTPGTGIGTGTASRITVITGSNGSTGETACTSIDTYTLDTVYPVAGQSTREATIRDSRGLVVRTESSIWKDTAWQLVSFTDFTYDFAGRLTSRVASNGATYEATYDGGLKMSETDEAGVVTEYAYDVHGRVSVSTRRESGVIGALATKYTYDASGRVTKEEVGYGQTSPITTQRAFDDAGRITSETPPGNYGAVAYTYNVAARTQTVTRADSSTIVTTSYLDGRLYSTDGSGTVAEYHTYGVDGYGNRWHQVNTGGSSSPRWQKSWKDWLGRAFKTEQPGFTGQPNVITENIYGEWVGLIAHGQIVKTTKTGFAPTLYEYNHLVQLCRSGMDCDGDGTLAPASSDRLIETDTYLESYGGKLWMRTDTRTYPKLGFSTVTATTTSRTRLTGHASNVLSETESVDAEGNLTTQKVEVNRGARTSTATTTRSGITGAMVELTVNGFSRTITSFDRLTITKDYDSFLRLNKVTNSRGNATTTTFIAGTARGGTVSNQAGNTSVTTYDTLGRVSNQRDPQNHRTRYAYNSRGQVIRQWGAGAMPVEYGYDSTYGERVSMKTYRGGTGWDSDTGDFSNTANPWPTNPGTADTTTWTYDGPSGLLSAKTDAAGRAVTQTYNLRGQTATRTLARGTVTTYSYDGLTGELLGQSYSDSTPAVTYTYGRSGQVESIADYTGTRDLVYDPVKPWRMTAEAESDFYGNRVLTRLYDESGSIGRVRGFQLGNAVGSASDLEQTFGFTTVGRFETVASRRLGDSGTLRRFLYTYRTDSALLQSLGIDQGSGQDFTVTRDFEADRDLVKSIDTKWSSVLRTGYSYSHDQRGYRATVVQSGSAFSDYGGEGEDATKTSQQFAYNGRGELTAAIGHLGSDPTDAGKQLPGRRHEYSYDPAGNRLWSHRTGVANLQDDYTTDALNQYVTRENNTVPLSGTAEPDTTPPGAGGVAVTVSGGTLNPVAAGRKGRYWNDEITVNNNANPLSPNPWRGALTIFTAKRGAIGSPDTFRADSRLVEIAARLQSFSYDLDGNLTSDGVADYQWDAENRLIRVETTTMAQSWGFPRRLLEFRYDYMGRRVSKMVAVWDSATSAWVTTYHRRYLYDGWNLVAEYAEINGNCGALLRSYTWGLDIVNSMASAGGVGALLQIADHPTGKTYLPAYDGNGNIAALFNASTGAVAAAYEYSPFGMPLRAQALDQTVADNPFRFSTKWTDLETGLVYYGHRYYEPKNGRFINRDPIEEAGGMNLYGFCGNNAINRWDVLGNAWEVTGNDDGSFNAYAWEAYDDAFIELGDWNFSSRADAEHWAAMRSRWEFDERGGIGVIVTASFAGEAVAEDPNTVEGRPHRKLGVGTGPYYGNTTWTGTPVYSAVDAIASRVSSSFAIESGGRPVPTKQSQNNPKKSATSFVSGDLSLLGVTLWLAGADAPNSTGGLPLVAGMTAVGTADALILGGSGTAGGTILLTTAGASTPFLLIPGDTRGIANAPHGKQGLIEGFTGYIQEIWREIRNPSPPMPTTWNAQEQRLSDWEIKQLQNAGIDPHDLKPQIQGSRYDLFKDAQGNIIVKPKDGSGPGDPTGINIKNLPPKG